MAVKEKVRGLEAIVDDVQGSIDQLDFAMMDVDATRNEIDGLLGVVQSAIEETMDEETGEVDLTKLNREPVSKAIVEMAEKSAWLTAFAADVAGFADDVEVSIETLKSQL